MDKQAIIDGGRRLTKVDFAMDGYEEDDRQFVQTMEEANCWSSVAVVQDGDFFDWHLPCFDVDIPREQVMLVDEDLKLRARPVWAWVDTAFSFLPNDPANPVRWVPSTTEGHHHVYIDYPYEWWDYIGRLYKLVELGIVEEGYYNAAERRMSTGVRLPHIRKEIQCQV